ncbi:FadR family transcriptional regulator [Actinomadura graeca]|uniref:FadR family transcriptional regulator n=1 Tax=Actinomadura graeca TaxID=2750812 RepID=A0ABX8QYD5_9ACTN|nr:FCD domain-containing protein [Actinomadura graeca]QXJ23849.1 FadR family transcriptional regulator [Actinomadura graeca]
MKSPAPVTVVKEFIRSSGLEAGDRLPPERDLAERLGLTRSQVRTAMRRLVDEGVVWRHVGRGTFLVPQVDEERRESVLRSINPRELIEARLALEPRNALLASLSASESDVAAMEEALERQRQARSREEFSRWDVEFHRRVTRAARNTLLLDLFLLVSPAGQQGWEYPRPRPLTPERQEQALQEHVRIVEAIRDGEPQLAERHMRRHLEVTHRRITSSSYLPVA